MERAAALTGPAGRPMIASGYEKAGRGGMNSLLPNGMKSFPAHLPTVSVPGVRLRASGYACDGNPIPPLRWVRLWLYVRARAAGF